MAMTTLEKLSQSLDCVNEALGQLATIIKNGEHIDMEDESGTLA